MRTVQSLAATVADGGPEEEAKAGSDEEDGLGVEGGEHRSGFRDW